MAVFKSIAAVTAWSVVYGLMWNLPDAVPLLGLAGASLVAANKVASNISWWFSIFGISGAVSLLSRLNENNSLLSSTTVYDPEGNVRYRCVGGGDTRPKDPVYFLPQFKQTTAPAAAPAAAQ